ARGSSTARARPPRARAAAPGRSRRPPRRRARRPTATTRRPAPRARARRGRRSPRRWRRSSPRRGLLPGDAEVASQPAVSPAKQRLVDEGLQPAERANTRREADLVDDAAAAAGEVEQRPVVPPHRRGAERRALA